MRKKVSQAWCRRWRRLHWRRKEAPLHRLSPSITSIPLYLSESLSPTTRSKKKWKYKRNEEEHLHYTILKIENLALK